MRAFHGAIRCGLLLAWAACAGCGVDHDANARKLVEPASFPGMVMQAMTGTGEQLVEQGRIDLHRRIKGIDDCEIDLWIIHSRRRDPADEGKRITRGTVIALHPMLASKSWFLHLGEVLARNGWDVVLPDLRAHGRSGGKHITWGVKEKHDIRCVMDDLLGERAVSPPIYIVGASMGGLVAVQYAAIDPRCRGVMALAPPTCARDAARRILLLESPDDFEEALRRAGALAGFDPEEASAVAAAGKLSCPLLIAHGIWDVVVPYQHSEAVFQAAPEPKKFVSLFLHGHASEIIREDWIAQHVDELAKMSERSSQRSDEAQK
jgi:pimeloyl-ACP methyl ester carboxylesterase